MSGGATSIEPITAADEIERLLADDAFGARLAGLRKAGRVLVIESGRQSIHGLSSQIVLIRPASSAPGKYDIAGVRLSMSSIASERTVRTVPLSWNAAARGIARRILGEAGDWRTAVVAPNDFRVAYVERFSGAGGE